MATTSLRIARGFLASGVTCGIKKRGGLDFAMVASEVPCTAAGVYTKNKFRAAPLTVSKELIDANPGNIQAVMINSGCANACTGEKGLATARESSALASETLRSANPNITGKVLVMSTGVIGQHLDMEKIAKGIQLSSKSLKTEQGWQDASQAIMTTDTKPKLVSRQIMLQGHGPITITGIAKGAGMIHPNMATMLGVLATDAAVGQKALQSALSYACDRSFNCVTVDGDTSTNDSVFLLANGQSKLPVIEDTTSPNYIAFRDGLTATAAELSKLLVRDGEGATKLAEITVTGANSYSDAHTIASSIATSSLVKTALYGQDANWGRILCAAGYSGISFDPSKVNLFMGCLDANGNRPLPEQQLVKDGAPFDVNEDTALAILKHTDITCRLELNIPGGKEQATYWTCDFSYDYVKVNASYRS